MISIFKIFVQIKLSIQIQTKKLNLHNHTVINHQYRYLEKWSTQRRIRMYHIRNHNKPFIQKLNIYALPK